VSSRGFGKRSVTLPCRVAAAAAATLPIGEIGVASGKPLRGEPERKKIDALRFAAVFLRSGRKGLAAREGEALRANAAAAAK
ncbi:hypothetical protein, partial [Bradyrhizobium stylosanthis]|uniref:hypothetical protein n=1 Tax=Bradyrhizobium stylosanthis TaxID=1803665 RepID=UPI001AED54D6